MAVRSLRARDEREAFVARLASWFAGWPPIAGRIFATLLLADEPELSGPQLAERLGVSAGSVSTMTRMLIRVGAVDRVKKPGERPDFYRSVIDTDVLLARLLEQLEGGASLADNIPASIGEAGAERLRAYAATYEVLVERIRPLTEIEHVSGRRSRKTG